ncbi:GGDEF domain-containing protein [Fusibacter sp. JL216-2]|uniref:GGDEF domain-containing protein n=1 Tax=Fusibacter sp. JL216-2 TaxID=3071453 RepID=UPI003D328E05
MNLIVKLPENLKEEYTSLRTNQNFNKLMISGAIVLVVQLLAVASNLIDPFTTHKLIMSHYLRFYYYTIGGHLVFLIGAHFIRRRNISVSLKRLFIHCYTYYIVFWAAGVAVADQFQGEEIVVYYTLVFILSIVLDIDTLTFFIIVAANHVMFLLLLTIYERFYTTLFGLRAGSTQIIAFIVLLRFYLHELMKKNFIQKAFLKSSAVKMKSLENLDSITGLLLRTQWEQMYKKAYSDAVMGSQSMGLCMIDIDAFSKYNKTYGHDKADALLRAVGRVIKQISDKHDGACARYTGDAFIVYFIDMDVDEFLALVKRMHQRIEDLNTEHVYSRNAKTITVTTGVYHNPTVVEGAQWDFIYAAEENLKKAKETN